MPKLVTYRTVFTADEIADAVPTEKCNTRYDNDPRVVQDGSGGVHVLRDTGVCYHVVDDGMAGWCIRDLLGHVVDLPGGAIASGFSNANTAIHCLIGGPRS